jgi:hypothetical protein
MFAQKKYEDAQPGQIREYATTFLQLDLKGTESDAEILAAVKRAQPGQEYIFVKFDEPEELQQVGGNVTAADLPDVRFVDDAARGKGTFGRNDPRCQIMIPPADTPDGNVDVAVGVNGVVWQLKRGVDLDVPLRVWLALMAAQQELVTHNQETHDTIISTALRFPIITNSRPSDAEIEAWKKETETQFCP